MQIKKGIDVSVHQGNINWKTVKDSNLIDFVIIRAGFGMYSFQKDKKFDKNYFEAKKNNIPIGIYWYSYATTIEEAKKEAKICLNLSKGKEYPLGIWFDQEYEPNIKALSKKMRTDICIAFMEEIKKANYKTGLYCSYDWLKNWVLEAPLKKYSKWLAEYGPTSCSYKGEDLLIWQKSSKGKIPGISTNVDINEGYFEESPSNPVGVWKKNSTGWWYEYPDQNYAKNQWLKIDNRWYWFDERGYSVKGYRVINNKKYYFAEEYFNGVKECQLLMTDGSGAILK